MNSSLGRLKHPVVAALLAGIVGFLLGLLWAWVIQPVKWTDATPEVLRSDLQQDYLRMVIDSFMANGDPDLALRRWQALGPDASQRLLEIQRAPGAQDPNAIVLFGQYVEAAGGLATPTATATAPPPSVTSYAVIAGALIVVMGVVLALFYFLRPRRRSGEITPQMQAQEITRHTERTDFESLGLAPPLTQSMTTYLLGDDLYDESFSIDSPAGEFLGEYGVGVSDTIGVGDPKKVSALEIWLFDKNDVKTATKVLMGAHAYNDLAIRQRLEAKGELVLIEPQKQIVLETATLQLMATVADMEYGSGPLPPNSYFERMTLELAVWPKQAG